MLILIALPKPAMLVEWEWPLNVLLVTAVCLLTWPSGASLAPSNWLGSVAVGALVFAVWIAPELINPHYRGLRLFSNSWLGHVGSTLAPAAIKSRWVLSWRTIRASTVVPVAEELFWRSFIMRWLIDNNFRKVPLGAYQPFAFWVTAFLFAAEHGPYWDVGLIAGIVYNWWMLRTKSLGSCVLMHAVTNLLLSAYVIAFRQWQFWQ